MLASNLGLHVLCVSSEWRVRAEPQQSVTFLFARCRYLSVSVATRIARRALTVSVFETKYPGNYGRQEEVGYYWKPKESWRAESIGDVTDDVT